ncbi:MAG TPA: AAA family ATPase [Candidatus Competibacteraceae bacterium]|nr:AAA family ATPase [Candidatus Competibacteraceae bacterium]
MTALILPDLALILLIGPAGAGKSTFARRHFRPTEVVSSDACRAWVRDDEGDQAATGDAFEVLHLIVAKRLAAGRLTVVDATNVQREARRPLLALARRHHCPTVAIVFDLPEAECQARNRARPERQVTAAVVREQHRQLQRTLAGLRQEGLRAVHVLRSAAAVEMATVERRPLPCDRRADSGPFDVIGDVHGCHGELRELLARLGYVPAGEGMRHPQGRRAVFVGDLVDRGPATPAVLRLVMAMVEQGDALCVVGNHDDKLARALRGRAVQVGHGLAESLAQLQGEGEDFRRRVAAFLEGLPSHYVLDGGRLVVAHAGLRAELHGRDSRSVRAFALYGDTGGEIDDYGLPVRRDWAAAYRGQALVVYGHTPLAEPTWQNNTLCIDTGCVFGGRLSALRYPEGELVAVPAQRCYWTPARPLG